MKTYIYCVRDKKLGAYDAPHFKNEDQEHVVEMTARSLKLIPADKISRAADQALYFLGMFDDVQGKFELLDQPEKLLDYEDYVPRKQI